MLPNVPTISQAGFPDLTFDGLVGLFGQRDMPLALRERIAADVKEVLSDPALAVKLTATGQEVVPGSAAEFAASIDQQFKAVAEIAKVLGLKAAQPAEILAEFVRRPDRATRFPFPADVPIKPWNVAARRAALKASRWRRPSTFSTAPT